LEQVVAQCNAVLWLHYSQTSLFLYIKLQLI
jgi:hypothetical protein